MKIRHKHIESVLLALAAEKGQAWVANAITEEYLRQGGGRRIAPYTRQGLEQSAEYLSPLVER